MMKTLYLIPILLCSLAFGQGIGGKTGIGGKAGIGGGAVAAKFDVGFDFRSTSAYVTDPTCCTYELGGAGDHYPTTRTVNGFSATFGYENFPTGDWGEANISTSVDPRIAGMNYTANVTTPSSAWTFRVDLPATGNYNISWVIGDAAGSYAQNNYITLEDTSSPLISYQPKNTTSLQFSDINGSTCTTPWTACINATSTKTFTTTILRVVLGGTTDSNTSVIAHLRITQQ